MEDDQDILRKLKDRLSKVISVNPFAGKINLVEVISKPITEIKQAFRPETITSGDAYAEEDAALNLKKSYQKELNKTWESIANVVYQIQLGAKELETCFKTAKKLLEDVKEKEAGLAALYHELANDIRKKTDTREMQPEIMIQYVKHHQELASDPSLSGLIKSISEKQEELKQAKKQYDSALSKYSHCLSVQDKQVQKAEQKFASYYDIFNDGRQELENCSYKKTISYKLSSEKDKVELKLETRNHKTKELRLELDFLKTELDRHNALLSQITGFSS
ncbi:MAG TPA: hypothetical protein ENN46_03370 [Candidatus Woesearchaeota archaeon]|mgnify:CR=1 FL=1|nr:hypothetical protein [Candidatus Woesearchaeota archaeon]